MTGAEIAAAFMQQNDKKLWGATARSTSGTDFVHFAAKQGMVSLIYNVSTGQFAVKFNRFQGAWGDYVKAIARSLFVVLNALKSAGLPFEAPPSLAGITIIATTGEDNTVYVSFKQHNGTPAELPNIL